MAEALSTPMTNAKQSGDTMNNAMITNLKQMYDECVKNNMPFVEQARLLSQLPPS